jgi:hypothetical protein
MFCVKMRIIEWNKWGTFLYIRDSTKQQVIRESYIIDTLLDYVGNVLFRTRVNSSDSNSE